MRALTEFSNAPIPDKRLQERLKVVGEMVARDPSASFPNAAGSAGDLEALYRFLNNGRVEVAAIVQPHFEATVARAQARQRIAVVHDTTDFVFSGESGESLGYIPTTGQRGFWGHFALAVGDRGDALGILGVEPMFFEKRTKGIRRNRAKAAKRYRRRRDKAALRWDRMVETVRNRLPTGVEAIHVMDREADSYRIFFGMVAREDRFVIRLRHDRRPARASNDDDWTTVTDVAKAATFTCAREVPLGRRRRVPGLNATHGPRDARTATLEISASPVTIKGPRLRPDVPGPRGPASLDLNLVRVVEVDAPPDSEAVEWLLITTQPISSRADVEDIVDWYRRRWVIEEYFRALKTGCAYERRQLESRSALLRTLALLVPIAWQLLHLRDSARCRPDHAALGVLRAEQIAIIRAITKNPMSDTPSLQEVLLAVAAQGGHLRRNGDPGWQTLGRGLEKVWWAEVGYRAAMQRRREK